MGTEWCILDGNRTIHNGNRTIHTWWEQNDTQCEQWSIHNGNRIIHSGSRTIMGTEPYREGTEWYIYIYIYTLQEPWYWPSCTEAVDEEGGKERPDDQQENQLLGHAWERPPLQSEGSHWCASIVQSNTLSATIQNNSTDGSIIKVLVFLVTHALLPPTTHTQVHTHTGTHTHTHRYTHTHTHTHRYTHTGIHTHRYTHTHRFTHTHRYTHTHTHTHTHTQVHTYWLFHYLLLPSPPSFLCQHSPLPFTMHCFSLPLVVLTIVLYQDCPYKYYGLATVQHQDCSYYSPTPTALTNTIVQHQDFLLILWSNTWTALTNTIVQHQDFLLILWSNTWTALTNTIVQHQDFLLILWSNTWTALTNTIVQDQDCSYYSPRPGLLLL